MTLRRLLQLLIAASNEHPNQLQLSVRIQDDDGLIDQQIMTVDDTCGQAYIIVEPLPARLFGPLDIRDPMENLSGFHRVQVDLTSGEYDSLFHDACLLAEGTMGAAVRRRMDMQPSPYGIKAARRRRASA